MEDTRRSSDSDDRHLLKVAVKLENHAPQLKKLDFSLPIEKVIKELCLEADIPYKFGCQSLWTTRNVYLNEETKHVSDENKHLVVPGSFLVLKPSPTVKIARLMEQVGEKDFFFLKIATKSRDLVLLRTLYTFDAHQTVFKILDEEWEVSAWAANALVFIHSMYVNRIIQRIPLKIISRFFESVAIAYSFNREHENFIVQCLKILSCVRRMHRLRYTREIFNHLSALLLLRDRPKVQEAALELLNFLVIYPKNIEEENEAVLCVVNQKIVGCICDHILRGDPSKEMQQQLYRYQTLVLRPYWHKKVSKVLITDPALDEIRRLTHAAKRGRPTQTRRRLLSEGSRESISPPRAPRGKATGLINNLKTSFRRARNRSAGSAKPSVHANQPSVETSTRALSPSRKSDVNQIRRKKFYSCIVNNADDSGSDEEFKLAFNFYGPIELRTPHVKPSGSAMVKSASAANLTQSTFVKRLVQEEDEMAKKDPALSSKSVMALTIDNLKYMARHSEDSYRRWAVGKERNTAFADQLTLAVCRVLEVGRPRPVDSPGDMFHPLVFFAYPHILEELFSEAFLLHERTSKEMKARGRRDEAKVFTVVQEQLECALGNTKPVTMVQLRDKLTRINYEFIAEKRRVEREESLQSDLRSKPLFLNYREERRPIMISLIKKQRMKFMKRGQHLPKLNPKGEVQKQVHDFLGLNRKVDHLVMGECYKAKDSCEHNKRIVVADIVDCSVGKQSKQYWDIFNQNESRVINKSPPAEWPCFFSLKMRDNEYHCFCAPDETSLNYWADGLNLLLGKAMNSPSMITELNQLLDMEVRLNFLDLEGLPIPDEAPTVPPLPPNFNFLARDKNRKAPNSWEYEV